MRMISWLTTPDASDSHGACLHQPCLTPSIGTRARRQNKFKCSASEGLTIHSVFNKFFTDVLLPKYAGTPKEASLRAMVTNYTDICDIVDLLHLSMYGRCVDPDLLQAKIDTWALSHEVAYGKTLTYLKTHLTAHLADVLRSRREVACANQPDNSDAAVAKIVIACWALERNVYA